MSKAQILKKLQAYKSNPDVFAALTPNELADLVIVVMGQVGELQKAIETKKYDLEKVLGKDISDYTAKEKREVAALKQQLIDSVNTKLQEATQTISENSTALERRVAQAIENIRDGENGIVTDEDIERAAVVAFEMIELPDFDKVVEERITANPMAVRDSLETIVDEEEKLSQDAISGLKEALAEIRRVASSGKGVAGGGIGKNTVLQLIAENAGGASISDAAYDASWDGVTDVAPSKNAVYDAIEAISVGGISDGDKGDITVSDSGATWTIDDGVVTNAKIADTTITEAKFADLGAVPFDITRTGDVAQGEIAWDNDKETFVFGIDGASIGANQPFWYVRNNTGATLTKGTPVYATGTVGASGRITVGKFIANGTIAKELLLGVLHDDIANGADGLAISTGVIRGIDTSAFTDGQILYPSAATAGTFTATEPTAPNLSMPVAFCVYSSATVGEIAVRINPHDGNDLPNASEVDFTPAGNIAATDVQAAIEELDSEKVNKVTSTDKAIARYNGTTGELQNSLAIVDNSGNIATPGRIGGGTTSPTAAIDARVATFGQPAFTVFDGYYTVNFGVGTANFGNERLSLYKLSHRGVLNNQGIAGASSATWEFHINGTEMMRIANNGNVGIGTASPVEKFAVAVPWTANTTNTIIGADVSGFTTSAIKQTNEDITNTHTALGFYTARSGVLAEKLRIDSNGNLGIGTTSPSAKLEVNGDFKYTSAAGTEVALGNVATSQVLDWSTASQITATMTGNTTFTHTNEVVAKKLTFIVTGAFTPTFSDVDFWGSGSAPGALTSGQTLIVSMLRSGTTVFASYEIFS